MFSNLLHLLFPKTCSGCGLLLQDSEAIICTICRYEMPLTNHNLDLENAAFKTFYGRLDIQFAGAFIEFHKKGIVQELIHKLKYKRRQDVGTCLGYWCSESWKKMEIIETIDYIIPVPLHKKRFRERGYNQITTFSKALSESWQIPILNNLLYRKHYSKTQVRKNRSQRGQEIANAFEIKNIKDLEGKHFLVLDDVLTTGATLESCCKELQKIKNIKISIICIAMTV
ncbi:MAG: ComF family protein [Flavobacterium sp.]|jgi:ComF family protein